MRIVIEFDGPADRETALDMLADNLGKLIFVVDKHPENVKEGYGVRHVDGHSTLFTKVEA